jgi:heme/copper-type cytochrome/quinol oxidase subunit 2
MKRKIVFLLLTFYFTLSTSAQSGEDQSAAEGINDGIIFLMAVPYILVAAIGYFIYRKYGVSKKIENTD